MNQLLLATNNPGKVKEISEMLSGSSLNVASYKDFINETIDVIEDGLTFEENAIKKVQAFPQLESVGYLSDDSGLEVDALDGRPGIYSARYAGEGATSDQLCHKILSELYGAGDRSARFVCVMALRLPDGSVQTVRGEVEGRIAYDMQGDQGFGYDPIFIPEDLDCTFADMSLEQKHEYSHRGRALNLIRNILV